MNGLFTQAYIIVAITAGLTSALPLMLAALGETIGEQSGVLNLGVEGIMLIGGFSGYVCVLNTHSVLLGGLCGAFFGILSSLILVSLSVMLGLNQIVVGIAITLAGEGVTSVLQQSKYGSSNPRLSSVSPVKIPLLSRIPIIGPSVFTQPIFLYISLLLALVVAWGLLKTNAGLRIKAAGQKPGSLDAAGGSVIRTRTFSVMLAGGFAGLGGAYFSIIGSGSFTPMMTGGLGYIAIVVAMLARGRVSWVVGGSLMFGFCVSLTTVLQMAGINIPSDVVNIIPFVAVLATLIIFARSAYIPPALGVPYIRGSR
jgi:general nucleoside transport system permease protein